MMMRAWSMGLEFQPLKLRWHIREHVNWRQTFHKRQEGRPKPSTCIVFFVRLLNFVDVSDTDLAEKVHEERSVEVFAHLVENKPGEESLQVCSSSSSFTSRQVLRLWQRPWWVQPWSTSWSSDKVSPWAGGIVTTPTCNVRWSPLLMKSFPSLYSSYWLLNLHWMARYRRRTRPMSRRRRNHHQSTKNTWYGRQSSNINIRMIMLLSVTPDLVVDNVEAKYADCVDILLTARHPPPPVVARSCQWIKMSTSWNINVFLTTFSTHSNLSWGMFGTLGFWRTEDVVPPREGGSSATPRGRTEGSDDWGTDW